MSLHLYTIMYIKITTIFIRIQFSIFFVKWGKKKEYYPPGAYLKGVPIHIMNIGFTLLKKKIS